MFVGRYCFVVTIFVIVILIYTLPVIINNMNDKNFELAKELIPSTYVDQGRDAIKRRENQVTELLSHKKIPDIGWDDQSIEYV